MKVLEFSLDQKNKICFTQLVNIKNILKFNPNCMGVCSSPIQPYLAKKALNLTQTVIRPVLAYFKPI